MGSLMAGWKTDAAIKRDDRRRSFTRDEIESFRKTKKQEQEEHAAHLDELLKEQQTAVSEAALSELSTSTKDRMTEEEMDGYIKDWWKRSKSAYMNEPPANYARGGNFKAQYDDENNYNFENLSTEH